MKRKAVFIQVSDNIREQGRHYEPVFKPSHHGSNPTLAVNFLIYIQVEARKNGG